MKRTKRKRKAKYGKRYASVVFNGQHIRLLTGKVWVRILSGVQVTREEFWEELESVKSVSNEDCRFCIGDEWNDETTLSVEILNNYDRFKAG